MAKTHNASDGEWVHLDPGVDGGPWTVTLPDTALDGYTCSIKDNAGDTTAISIDPLSATAKVEDPSTAGTFGAAGAAVTLNFGNISAITFRYNSGMDIWYVVSTAKPD